jgi:hypothetical protein
MYSLKENISVSPLQSLPDELFSIDDNLVCRIALGLAVNV